jgi:predicted membrane-bound spermidine synthase
MAQRLISYLFPRLVASFNSPVNGRINVYRQFNSYRIVIGGLTESGGLMGNLWESALKSAKKHYFRDHPPKNCLILGYGGGSATQVVRRSWPTTEILGIELDPLMVELGKKYVYQPKSRVSVEIADVFEWMNNNNTLYDLILIDLFLGKLIPNQVFSAGFIKQIKQSLTPAGCALFNIFALKKHQPEALNYIHKLEANFTYVSRLHTISNWIILASLSPGNASPNQLK